MISDDQIQLKMYLDKVLNFYQFTSAYFFYILINTFFLIVK